MDHGIQGHYSLAVPHNAGCVRMSGVRKRVSRSVCSRVKVKVFLEVLFSLIAPGTPAA